MDAHAVKALIETSLRESDGDVSVSVEGAGSHYDVTVVSTLFADQRAVKRQQTVYAALREVIADGSVHAVNIRAMTPDEWDSRGP
jgi:acid stress-induced BolA-like protein IbaG/YrbA